MYSTSLCSIFCLPPLPCVFFLYNVRRTCPKSDPRFKPLIQRVTQNFDTFEDFGTNLDGDD
eukprot:scaffold21366_cov60-Attheya_sp.AAC.4